MSPDLTLDQRLKEVSRLQEVVEKNWTEENPPDSLIADVEKLIEHSSTVSNLLDDPEKLNQYFPPNQLEHVKSLMTAITEMSQGLLNKLQVAKKKHELIDQIINFKEKL